MDIKEVLSLALKLKFFDKKASGGAIKNQVMSNKDLTEELYKPVTKKFNKRKVQSQFIDNIWGADIADKKLISKFYQENCFLLCVIDILSKYAWVIPLKDEKGITITNAFQKISKEFNHKPSKIWVDKGNEFFNRSMK